MYTPMPPYPRQVPGIMQAKRDVYMRLEGDVGNNFPKGMDTTFLRPKCNPSAEPPTTLWPLRHGSCKTAVA